MSGLIKEASDRLTRPGKSRQLLWRTSVKTAIVDGGIASSSSSELSALFYETLPCYIDRKAQEAVLQALTSALQIDAFLKAFTAHLVKHGSSKQQPTRQAAFLILEWSCAVLQRLDPAAAKKAIAKVIEVQSSLLDVLITSDAKWKPVARVVLRLLRKRPELLSEYLEVAAAAPSAGIISAVLAYAQRTPDAMPACKQALLPAYTDKVLASRDRITPTLLSAFAPALAALTHDEFSQQLMPSVTRLMRRTPDVLLAALPSLFASCTLDMSRYSGELLPLLLQQLRLKEAVRPLATDALAALAKQISDADVLQQHVTAVAKLLDGSAEGKIKSAAERAALAAALRALCSAPGRGAAAAAVAADVAAFISKYTKEEVNEDVRQALVAALGAWLPRCALPPPAAALDLLQAGLKDAKEAARRAALRSAAAAAKAAAGLRPHLAGCTAPLLKLIGDGITRATQRGDAVTALLLLAQIAAADGATAEVLAKDGTWAAALKPDSPLLSAAAAAKLAASEAACLAEVSEVLLMQLTQGPTEALCQLLAALLQHHAKEVRAAAVAATGRALAASPTTMAPLLAGLRAWLAAPAPTLQDPAATGDDAVVSSGARAQRLGAAALALVPTSGAELLGAGELLQLLLAAHHPAATAWRRSASEVWRRACCKLPGIKDRLAGAAGELVQLLAGPGGLQSSEASEQQAALAALGSCMAAAPAAVFPHLLPVLQQLLERSAHSALSEQELLVYSTPEGVLSYERLPEGAYVPQVVKSKNIRKPRGRMRADNSAFAEQSYDDDEEEEEEPPQPAARVPLARAASGGKAAGGKAVAGGRGGGRAGGGLSKEEEYRQRKLAEEAQVRARVAAIRAQLELGLQLLTAAAAADKSFTREHLRELAPLALPLLASPLAGAAAQAAAEALARALAGPLARQSVGIAAGLRLVVLAGEGRELSYADVPHRAPVASVIHAMAQGTSGRRSLPSSTYRFLFPVLQAVLSSPQHTPLHDVALGVLALHVAPGQDVPRQQSLKLLYHLLAIIPAYRDRVVPLLRSLCGGVDAEDLPAALAGLQGGSALVRAAALAALPCVPCVAEGCYPQEIGMVAPLHIAGHDVNEDNAAAAEAIWVQAGCEMQECYPPAMLPALESPHDDVRQAAAAALASAANEFPHTLPPLLGDLVALYTASDSAEGRGGVAYALRSLSPILPEAQVPVALDFLVGSGLGDVDDGVRALMVEAGVAIVDAHGQALGHNMLPLFESHLEKRRAAGGAAGGDESHSDLVREGVVVLLGTLARHMAPGDPKRRAVLETLLEVLSTPSEAVQRAVSSCLAPLMTPLAAERAYVEELLERLLARLTDAKSSYGEKRGAAFGLAGVVKGLGISSLRAYGLMDRLREAVEERGSAASREGGLLAFEGLCDKLGKLFEPYVIHILPLLLNCFGDSAGAVRGAAEDAARAIMAQLTASGVKLVLPALLKGLEERVWRTKQGSVQLLGAMAHCAPRQLGTCLPTIVPRLGEVLGDPHPKVQAAAQEALAQVGSVIRNPEVQSLVPGLLAAISKPADNTRACLDMLLNTTFINTIDAPSLALIVPVVHRGLKDRSGDTKKRAARIVGNMCTLINDPKDMAPYVPVLMPELQRALIDPLPEVRATAARAMGSLLQGMGAATLGDLVPWLLATLRSEASAVERQGAAQGLAEVLAVLGVAHLDALLPELLASCSSRSPYVREGSLTLFRFLPHTLAAAFQPYLRQALPLILDGLSDESEGVRDAALAAGRTFVEQYAQSSLPLLLPAVEAAVYNENWRIRQASVELCGELLFKVAGTSGKVQVDGGSDDEGAAHENYGAAIMEALGAERRNEVLARLYVVRSDVQYTVRNAALHVWKTLVVNTPKTLAEVLEALMKEVIQGLADPGEDRRQMAARCLGELVRKMGERVLARIVPILRDGMDSDDAATRQGVCFGLKEVLENISRQQLGEHLADVLPAVQAALCDEDADVREAAGAAFSILFRGGAASAVDTVVPSLLTGLESPGHYGRSLEGLRVLLGVRPALLNALVPKLLRAPLQSSSVRALGELADVAGEALHPHLATIMSALLPLASQAGAKPAGDAAAAAVLSVALAVHDDGLGLLLPELLKGLEEPGRRLGTAHLLAAFCRGTRLDLEAHLPSLLTALVELMAEEEPAALQACWAALQAVAAAIPKEELPAYVRPLKEAVGTAREKERRKRKGGQLLLAGLCLPKALAPVLPIYLQAVLQGSSAEVREMAAEGLGELVEVTGEDSLRPFVVQITGPLIRIIGDRFPSQIKAAILTTLGLLIARAGAGLKPFVPQLQTTFLKCLNDAAPDVRARAAANLGRLTALSMRVDQLASELAGSAASAADAEVAASYLAALRGTLVVSGERLSPAVVAKVVEGLRGMAAGVDENDAYNAALAAALGAACRCCSAEDLKSLLAAGPLAATQPANWASRHTAAMVLAAAAQQAPGRLEEAGLLKQCVDAAVRYSRDDRVEIKIAGGRAAARLAAAHASALPALAGVMLTLLSPDQSSEVQRQGLITLRRLALVDPGLLAGQYAAIVPLMCAVVSSASSGPLRSAADQSLRKVLRLDSGLEVAQAFVGSGQAGGAKSVLTDGYIRRLNKLAEDDDLEWEKEEY